MKAVFVLLCLVPMWVSASVRLVYQPSIPVQYTSKLTIDMHESLPVLNMTTKAKQIIKLDGILATPQNNQPIDQTTFDLTVTFRDIFVGLGINQEDFTYDPKAERAVIPLMQLAKVIDRPIHLTLDTDNILADRSKDIERVLTELPALKEMHFLEALNDILAHLFSLIDKDLNVGDSFKISNSNGMSELFPSSTTYQIKSIDAQEIVAIISGKSEAFKTVLESLLQVDDKEEIVQMISKSSIKGEISWNRRNAMICTFKGEYFLNAHLKAGPQEWDLIFNMVHNLTSSKP